MTERAEQLMGELVNEMRKTPEDGAPPTGVTRHNLNEMRQALPTIFITVAFENEFRTPAALRLGDLFYRELIDAEVAAYQAKGQGPGEPMTWQDVRDVYTLYLTRTIEAMTPEGIAKRKAVLKAEQDAAVAAPSLNEMKTAVPDTVIKTPTDAQLVS